MTNAQIIYNAALAHGFTESQLSQLLAAYHGDLPFHTIPEWSRRGYHMKDNARPLFDCYLWKHTDKPSAAAIKAAQEAGEDVPEAFSHFYQKLSFIYSISQVEKNVPALNLETIKARLDSLPGLTYKVKGEKTGSPNVWITAGADAHTETIKALGGIWSNKKSAYWIKPGTATAPAVDKPAAPVRETAPKMQTLTIHPGRPTPQPWKKCSFYTIRRDDKTGKPTAQQVDGYTDGIYNYYAIGEKQKTWYAIHPVFGVSAAQENTRQAAQTRALELYESTRKICSGENSHLQAYAAIRAAQDGDNLSLF